MENFPTNQDGAQPIAPSFDNSNPTLTAAIQAAELGFSIVPVNPKTKRPTAEWTEFQTRARTPGEVAKLKSQKAFAIVGGAVSGGKSPDGEQLYMTSMDFDAEAERLFAEWRQATGDLSDGLPVQRTGGGGYQVLFKSPIEIRNTQLAFSPNEAEEIGREIAIETRGEGGYFVAPPSLHPTGNRYEWIEGDLSSVPVISTAHAQALLDAARRLDAAPYTRQQLEGQQKREQSAKPRQLPNAPSASVIERFNATHNVQEMLERNGYKRKGERYARPGGSSPSVVILDGGSYHHSSNDPLRCDGHSQDAFSIFAYYEHGNDYKSAVKSAAEELAMSFTRNDMNAVARDDSNYVNSKAAGGTLEQMLELADATPTITETANLNAAGIAAPAFEVFSFADLAKMPRPLWLIRGLLIEKTTSVLSADGGSFKSFIALDMALCIATGTPFQGREVKCGPVVFVAAEGFYTVYERALAWAQKRGVELPDNFHILRAPVNVSNATEVAKFVAQFRELSPVFAVLDTLSQNALGLNENANEDMARFMAGMAATGTGLGAHVMVVHHNAKVSGAFRGAGAIRNNVDTHISLDRPDEDDTRVNVRPAKQRPARPFEAFELRGVEVELPIQDEFGDAITSLVFEATGAKVSQSAAAHPNAVRADATSEKLLALFDELATETPDGVKVGTWAGRAIKDKENPKGICSSGTFFGRLKIFKGEDEGKSAPKIEYCGIHSGSDLFRRCDLTPTTPTTPNCSSWSDGHNLTTSNSNNSNNPLGVGVVGVEWSGVRNGVVGAPKADRQRRAKNSVDAEPYKATSAADEIRDGAL